jgi:hypothetical protein
VGWSFQLPTSVAADVGTDLDVHQAGPSSPDDDVARRWIMGSRRIAYELGDLGQIVGNGSAWLFILSGNCKSIGQGDFNIGQY